LKFSTVPGEEFTLIQVVKEYVEPSSGEVWKVMRSVREWVMNPEREGKTPLN
jgi:hypothetical protein